jgi:hypothetical protein
MNNWKRLGLISWDREVIHKILHPEINGSRNSDRNDKKNKEEYDQRFATDASNTAATAC